MLDLDWVWNYPPSKGGPNEHDWFHDTKPNCTAIQGANGGQVICISGCDDNQESADTNAFGDHRSKQGRVGVDVCPECLPSPPPPPFI